MLKNKNNFEIIHSFFSLLGRELFRPLSYIQGLSQAIPCTSDNDSRSIAQSKTTTRQAIYYVHTT